jgi:hypothetical protein
MMTPNSKFAISVTVWQDDKPIKLGDDFRLILDSQQCSIFEVPAEEVVVKTKEMVEDFKKQHTDVKISSVAIVSAEPSGAAVFGEKEAVCSPTEVGFNLLSLAEKIYVELTGLYN